MKVCGGERTELTLITSNGCVASVAMAPAPAAETVCTAVDERMVESVARFASGASAR